MPKRRNLAGPDAMVDDPFGDRGTEPADQRMLLDGRHQLEPRKCLFETGVIERLDGVEAHHLGRDALFLELWPASTASGSMLPVDSRQTSVPSAIVRCLADGEIGDRSLVDDRLALLAHADVDRLVLFHDGAQRAAHLEGVARADHHHVGERAQERNVLAGMVGRTEPRIGQAGADRDDGDRHVVIADIGADLFEAARRHERGDRVGDRPQPRHRHAGRDAHHVLLGDAAIEEAARMLVLELVEQPVADVARQHDDAFVLIAELGHRP